MEDMARINQQNQQDQLKDDSITSWGGVEEPPQEIDIARQRLKQKLGREPT